MTEVGDDGSQTSPLGEEKHFEEAEVDFTMKKTSKNKTLKKKALKKQR